MARRSFDRKTLLSIVVSALVAAAAPDFQAVMPQEGRDTADLLLVKAGRMQFPFIPLGPLAPLKRLTK